MLARWNVYAHHRGKRRVGSLRIKRENLVVKYSFCEAFTRTQECLWMKIRSSREFTNHFCCAIAGSRVLKSMKAMAYRLVATRRSYSFIGHVLFFSTTSSLHAPIGWYPILPCHGKIKRAFSAASYLGNPLAHHSSTIDPRPIPEPKAFLHDKTVWRATRNMFSFGAAIF